VQLEYYDVDVQRRQVAGKGEIRRLKDDGYIPAVLYEHGSSVPVSVQLDKIKDFLNKNEEDAILNLHFNGSNIKAKIREIQRDPVNTDEIKHVDLMPVEEKYLH
jgi:ribosomal protein L25 (general stress protein Ctc)